MKKKAVRIQRAKHQQRVFREELTKKHERESNLSEFGYWIWSNLDTHMRSSKEVTLVDTPDIQVQASLNIMAVANSTDNSIQKSGTFSSLKEIISWKLYINIQSVEDGRQQQEQQARAKDFRSAWRLLPLDLECLQIGPRRIMTVPVCKRRKESGKVWYKLL